MVCIADTETVKSYTVCEYVNVIVQYLSVHNYFLLVCRLSAHASISSSRFNESRHVRSSLLNIESETTWTFNRVANCFPFLKYIIFFKVPTKDQERIGKAWFSLYGAIF